MQNPFRYGYDTEEGRTDFFVVLDYKKMRAVRVVEMEDADGEKEKCLVIPIIKNGIRMFGKSKWRIILAARKSHRKENASHVLVPQIEECTFKVMAKLGITKRYLYGAPIVGDVVPDITKIPSPPVFTETSLAKHDMDTHTTENPEEGITVDMVDKDGNIDNGVNLENKISSARQSARERILAMRKSEK